MSGARGLLTTSSVAALGVLAWLLWPGDPSDATSVAVLVLLGLGGAFTAACLLRPRPAFWAASLGLLFAAAVVGLEGSLDPDWVQGLAVAASLLVLSESQHLLVRTDAWAAESDRSLTFAMVAPVVSSLAAWTVLTLLVVGGLLAGWSILMASAAPTVVAASTDAWSGWVVALVVSVATVVAWILPAVWRLPRALTTRTTAAAQQDEPDAETEPSVLPEGATGSRA